MRKNMSQKMKYKYFCLTDRPMDKIFAEQMLICKMNLHNKDWTSILIRGGENHVSPKPDGQTYGWMAIIINSSFATKKNIMW